MERVYHLRSSKGYSEYVSCDTMVSNTDTPLYDVNIDFDEASVEWRRNKKQLTNCTFAYVCGMSTKNGKPCQRCESHRRFHVDKSK